MLDSEGKQNRTASPYFNITAFVRSFLIRFDYNLFKIITTLLVIMGDLTSQY
jgi:hypothetical protein